MKILNTYINNVSKGIRDRKVKNELKDELLSHLLEIYERNIALGLSDEDAQKDAVAHMGDSEAVSKTFKQIYPISSAEYFRRSGWCLAYPLLLYFSYGLRAVDTLCIITFFLFLALYRIRKVNKIFNTAFITTIANGVVQIVFFVLQNYILFEKNFSLFVVLSYQIMIVVIYTLIILGLIQIKKELNEPKEDFWLAYASIPALILSNTLAIVSKFLGYSDWGFPALLIGFIINFLPAAVIYTTVRDIDNLGLQIPQKMHTKKKVVITFLIIFIVTLSLCIYSVFVPYPPVDYSTNDVNTDVAEIKNNLIELGLPQGIVEELPESEILKYKGATELHIDSFSDDTYSYSDSYYTSYNFTLCKNDNAFVVRTLMVVENFEDFKEKQYTELFIDCYKYDSSDIFCKFLCDYNSETKEISPIKCKPIEDESFKDLHYVFPNTKDAKNHRAYISMTVTLTPMTDDENYFYKHKYAQTRLVDINNPYSKYWTRDDDWFSCSIANPYYIETEDNNNIGFGALFEILENLPEDESIDLSELESTMEDALGQDVDSKLLENMFNQITDEVSTP